MIAETLRALIERWRTHASDTPMTSFVGLTLTACANELEASLRLSPSQEPAALIEQWQRLKPTMFTEDEDGIVALVPPYSWETVARVAVDVLKALPSAPVAKDSAGSLSEGEPVDPRVENINERNEIPR